MKSHSHSTPSKHRFLELAQVAFYYDQKAENYITELFYPLKYCFLDITQYELRAVKEAENDFACTFDP
jgi:hypothetical protein